MKLTLTIISIILFSLIAVYLLDFIFEAIARTFVFVYGVSN